MGGLDDPVGNLRRAVDGVLDQSPDGLTDAELGADLVRMRRQIDRLEAAFAARTLAAHRRGVGLEDGHQSTPAWISWQTGVPRPAVGKVLRHAELAELLPETGQAWRDGTITATAVDMIAAARVADCDEELAACEDEFLDRARRGDHKTLKTLTRHFAECARANGTKPVPPDGVTLAEVGHRFVLRGDFDPTGAETIAEAFDAFTRPPSPEDGTTLAVRRAEAFVRICAVALGRGVDAEGARPVIGYLTQQRDREDANQPLTLAAFAGVIGPNDRDRLLCDATISRIVTDPAGRPLDVGRATSVWPVAIRRAIIARDRHCRWPGCEMPAPWCDAHHFEHWEDGGETNVENGLLLCRRHHSFLHAHANWTTTFDDQEFRVHRPDGTEVHPDPWHAENQAA